MLSKNKKTRIIISVFTTLAVLIIISLLYKPAESKNFGDITTEISLPTVQCGMCEKTITKALNKVQGVKDFNIDIENKKITITFDDSLTNLTSIEDAITKSGYGANDKKADPEAYQKLH